MKENAPRKKLVVEKITEWIGSVQSLAFHSTVFAVFFFVTVATDLPRDLVLLVWNTLVSLEAIYLAIFIQMTVNRHSDELEEVSEDVEDIQENIDEIQEDVGEIQKDIDEVQEDVEDIQEDDAKDSTRRTRQMAALETLTQDVRRMLADLETLRSANGASEKGEP